MTTERARVRRELDAVLKTFFSRASAGTSQHATTPELVDGNACNENKICYNRRAARE